MSEIHPSAIVHPGAKIGPGCSVGPYTVIGSKVVLGEGNWVGPHVVLEGNTHIGTGNKIFQFASVGAQPQDLKFRGENSSLEIGDNNIIREYVTLQPGTEGGGMKTTIGSRNLFMACCHVGHDSHIGDGNVVANAAAIAGHVEIGNCVTVGGLCGVHQFVRVGDYAILSAGAMVSMDIPPFCTAQGDRAKLAGLNKVGLSRHGFSEADMRSLKSLYRLLFLSPGLMKEKLEQASQDFAALPSAIKLLNFIAESKRGIASARAGRAQPTEGSKHDD